MATKTQLLRLLEENRDKQLSGEELAGRLYVSRSAVWKAAEALRKDGYEIEAVPGGGYRLGEGSDLLSEQGIGAHLQTKRVVRVLPLVDSTSLEARRWALDGAPHGAIVVAEKQSGGKGRRGRGFESPPGGIYMSVVLRPELDMQDAVLVTTAAAVAVCRAVQALCGLELDIKWVNDLFYKGRKCCGILSEGGAGLEAGSLEYIVVGIGINYTTPGRAFPKELRSIVSSLYPKGGAPVPRNTLIARIADNLTGLFDALPDNSFLEEYRRRCFVLGREITVLKDPPYTARATQVDSAARLVVKKPDGEVESLSSGEISIKL